MAMEAKLYLTEMLPCKHIDFTPYNLNRRWMDDNYFANFFVFVVLFDKILSKIGPIHVTITYLCRFGFSLHGEL